MPPGYRDCFYRGECPEKTFLALTRRWPVLVVAWLVRPGPVLPSARRWPRGVSSSLSSPGVNPGSRQSHNLFSSLVCPSASDRREGGDVQEGDFLVLPPSNPPASCGSCSVVRRPAFVGGYGGRTTKRRKEGGGFAPTQGNCIQIDRSTDLQTIFRKPER